MSECRKIERLLWEYPDGELSAAEREAISLHLEDCEACKRALQTIGSLRESKKADLKAISSIDAFAFDNAVMSRIRTETAAPVSETRERQYMFRMAVSVGLAAAIVIFLVFSISDLGDMALQRGRGEKPATMAEKRYERIDITLSSPETEKKSDMALGRMAESEEVDVSSPETEKKLDMAPRRMAESEEVDVSSPETGKKLDMAPGRMAESEEVAVSSPETEKKLDMAPGRMAESAEVAVESFSILLGSVTRPAPESVNIDAVYLMDETVPYVSQQARASLSEIVVDTGMIQSAETPISMLVTVEKMPAPLDVVLPEYPVWAKKRGVSGVVWVKARIDENGTVIDAQILSRSIAGMGFEESAIEAALKSTYIPAEANGKRLPVWIVYPVRFVYKTLSP